MLHGDPGIGVLSMRIGMNQIIYAPSYAPAYKVLSMRIGMNRKKGCNFQQTCSTIH